MDNQKIGDFISTLRKKKNLTQKDLADQLGVTDKAVSKWERGAGYPDIAMLRPLADILDTTVNELLDGEASEPVDPKRSNDLENALNYADKIIAIKENRIGKFFAVLTAILLILGIFSSVIVNVAVSQNLTWSILVIAGCTMGGCIFLPPLLYKGRGFFYSLCLLALTIMPFLAIIQNVTSDYGVSSGWLWRIGFPVSVAWLAVMWIMVLLYKKTKMNIWFLSCIGAILCIPGEIITNYAVDEYVDNIANKHSNQISTVSSVIALICIAAILLIIGLIRRQSDRIR